MSTEIDALTILLVDDDDDCRMLVRDAIAECKLSNSVVEARNGHEALDLLTKSGRPGGMPRPPILRHSLPPWKLPSPSWNRKARPC